MFNHFHTRLARRPCTLPFYLLSSFPCTLTCIICTIPTSMSLKSMEHEVYDKHFRDWGDILYIYILSQNFHDM